MSNTHVRENSENPLHTTYKMIYLIFGKHITTIILEIYIIKFVYVMVKLKTNGYRKGNSCCCNKHSSERFVTENNIELHAVKVV